MESHREVLTPFRTYCNDGQGNSSTSKGINPLEESRKASKKAKKGPFKGSGVQIGGGNINSLGNPAELASMAQMANQNQVIKDRGVLIREKIEWFLELLEDKDKYYECQREGEYALKVGFNSEFRGQTVQGGMTDRGTYGGGFQASQGSLTDRGKDYEGSLSYRAETEVGIEGGSSTARESKSSKKGLGGISISFPKIPSLSKASSKSSVASSKNSKKPENESSQSKKKLGLKLNIFSQEKKQGSLEIGEGLIEEEDENDHFDSNNVHFNSVPPQKSDFGFFKEHQETIERAEKVSQGVNNDALSNLMSDFSCWFPR